MDVVCIALILYRYVLLARVIMSWVPRMPDGLRPVAEVVFLLTDPVVRAVRPLMPPLRIGMVALDLSILLVFIALSLLIPAVCT